MSIRPEMARAVIETVARRSPEKEITRAAATVKR
jgi:hypothetical protein